MLINRVILGISGGVDSAVAGLMLKKKGYEVLGVFMRNWDAKDEVGVCSLDNEEKDAEFICRQIGIPFHSVNFVQEYWNDVFSYLLEGYQNGLTPNPDIYCNRYVKFNHFWKYAQEKLEAEAIATGHYARSSFGNFLEKCQTQEGVKLLKAADEVKDQTFFLSQVPQLTLRRTMFPLGDLKKVEVRRIASSNGLDQVAQKEESTGICFIGKRNFQSFITQYIEDKPGDFIDVDNMAKVGEHQGFHHWTVGQRAKIPGYPWKYYTCGKDVETNTIYVARGGNHLCLFANTMTVGEFLWINGPPQKLLKEGQLKCQFRFQHGKPLVNCFVKTFSSDDFQSHKSNINASQDHASYCSYSILLDHPLRALTPGQFAVLYDGNECLGSAPISCVGPSLYERLNDLNQDKRLFHNL